MRPWELWSPSDVAAVPQKRSVSCFYVDVTSGRFPENLPQERPKPKVLQVCLGLHAFRWPKRQGKNRPLCCQKRSLAAEMAIRIQNPGWKSCRYSAYSYSFTKVYAFFGVCCLFWEWSTMSLLGVKWGSKLTQNHHPVSSLRKQSGSHQSTLAHPTIRPP